HQRDGPPPTPRAAPATGFDGLVDTSLVRVVDPSVHTVTSSRCSATCSGPVALAARGRVGQAATMPPSAITAPPSHSSPIPGFTKNRNDARVSFSTVTSDAYRSTMPLKGVPVLIDGVPIGSDADGYRFSDG